VSAEDPATLVPARILNEHVYCPRLAYLMWVDQENTHNAATLEGELAHRRVDRGHDTVASPSDDRPRVIRSLQLASERIGVAARVDLVELDGRRAVPVEYKRGHPIAPDHPLHDPELVQLTAQVLLLRDSGFEVDHGEVYFAGTHSRHAVEITPELEKRARIAVREVLENASKPAAPAPLIDSPKCPHCVLLNLCMPDETEVLRGERSEPPRRLIAGDPPGHPLYLTQPGSHLAKRGGRLVLRIDRTDAASVRMLDVAHVAAFGNADISSAAMRACFEAGVPVLWLTSGGWLVGYSGPANASAPSSRHRSVAHRRTAKSAGGASRARGGPPAPARNRRDRSTPLLPEVRGNASRQTRSTGVRRAHPPASSRSG
jgi:CRISP-associated protein Cas1